MKKNSFMKLMFVAVTLTLVLYSPSALAQSTLVKDGKAKGCIVYDGNDSINIKAAQLLQDFVMRMAGVELPTKSLSLTKVIKPNDVLIVTEPYAGVTEDGCHISITDRVKISGQAKGALYGVVTLLEKFLGCNCWSANEYTIPSLKTVRLPRTELTDNPSFRYRQSNSYALDIDPVFRSWYRWEEPNETFAGNFWVHTENRFMPAWRYEKEHPEYYAFFNGKRHPGAQLCMTNPDVANVLTERLDSIFKANPGRNMISVSQNDGNGTNCMCDDCRKIDEYEESLSGSIITMMNTLAQRFPDKEISTLAYLFSVKPPKHLKPLPNVNIMLCDIDCMREQALTETATGKDFVKDLEGWASISDNIFLWNYGINFDGFLTPFPNFHTLKPNVELFKKNHVNMYFEQNACAWGGDFSELRAFMTSKLMWNHTADADSLMNTFINGYYEEAAPFIKDYLNTITGALLASGHRLWIYDTPVSHKDGMLRPALLRRYDELYDKAEKAAAGNERVLKRVRRARLSLQYAELELARASKDKDLNQVKSLLGLFEQRCKEYNVTMLNERSNSPLEYCQLYRERYLPSATKNIAAGAKCSYTPEIPQTYRNLGESGLTDGIYGGSTYGDSWMGWEGCDATIVMDLGEVKTFHSINADFLHQLGAWILLPKQVTYSVSDDGQNYKVLETISIPESRETQVRFVGVKHQSQMAINARYIKIDVVGTKDCPQWHYGVGNPCWFFLDEVNVQ